MRGRRCDDVHNLHPFRSQQFFWRLEAPDARDDITHRSQRRIGWVGHRHQLGAGATGDRASMVLRVATGTDQRDPERT